MGTPVIEIEGYADVVRIGDGGAGVVYRATRVSTGAVVAIKVLRDISDESVAWHRTRRELTALVALAGHANVIRLFELFELEQGPALSMEYAPGGSIADLLERRDDVLTLAETVLIGRQTAAALAAAHAQGIVHRDIKPHNLLIDAYGQIKLCDFGIASLTRTDGFRTRTNAWSTRYASPEDLDCDVDVGPASDVYSLGATLLHVARGAPPSLKDRLAEWIPPGGHDPHRAELDAVLAACLHPDPARRPSADEVVDRLELLGWALDERCRALPVETPAPADRWSRSFGDCSERDGADVLGASASRAGPIAVDTGSGPLRDPSIGFYSDQTLVRAGRRPPPRPGPQPRARRPWPLIAAGAATILVLALAAVVLSPNGPDSSNTALTPATNPATAAATRPEAATTDVSPSTSPNDVAPTTVAEPVAGDPGVLLVDRPAGLVAIDQPTVVWPFGAVGECLVQLPSVAELQPVSCQQAHDLQRIAVAELDTAQFPADAAFDQEQVQAAAVAACAAGLEAFVGPGPNTALFDVPLTRPSAASWEQGDRRLQCLLGVAGRRIVGDAAHAATG